MQSQIADPTRSLTPPRVEAFLGLFAPEPLAVPETDANGRAVLNIRGMIGLDVWSDDLANVLDQIDATTIELRIHSPGGNAYDGVAIANDLRRHAAAIDVHVVGVAASAASVIAMAGDTITMHPGALMMVHNGRAFVEGGTAEDLRATADLLDKVNTNMAEIYHARSGQGSVESWLQVMAAESWYTADEAVAAGLATSAPSAGLEPAEVPNAEAMASVGAVLGFDRYPIQADVAGPDEIQASTPEPVAEPVAPLFDTAALFAPRPPDPAQLAALIDTLYTTPQPPDPAELARAILGKG